LSAFFVTAFLKIDILIISRMLPIGEVGIYSAAMRIVETYMIAISVFFSQSLVWLTESHQDKALYQIRLSRLFKAGFAISLACLLFNMFAGEVLFSYLLGSKYTDAARLSTLLCFTLFATTSGTIRGYAFSLDGLNRFHFWSALLGLVLGVPLTIVLTKEMGLKGTAVALSVAYFVSAIGTSIVFPPLRLLARLQLLLRPSYPGATGSVHS
jgi:hypothetical protein